MPSCRPSGRWLDCSNAWPSRICPHGLPEVSWWVQSLVDELASFLIKQKLQSLGVIDLIGARIWHDHVTDGRCLLGLLLKRKGISRDNQILESWQLRDSEEKLFFMWDFVKGEVELFKVGENLLVQR